VVQATFCIHAFKQRQLLAMRTTIESMKSQLHGGSPPGGDMAALSSASSTGVGGGGSRSGEAK
jgi:hypothetical protein